MNRLVRPIQFAFEPDVVLQYSKVSFGASGAPTLDTNNSKGVCNIARNSIVTTASIANTSTSVTGAGSLVGIYNGMKVTGTGIPASTTVSSVNPAAGTFTLSNAATATNAAASLTFSGGQYTLTFGSQFTPFMRLDAYVKLLSLSHNWDESVNNLAGAGSSPAAPTAPTMILIGNNISNGQLANLVLQFGTGTGSSFTAADPASGEVVRIAAQLCRSTAI